jgi:hypothetical protein
LDLAIISVYMEREEKGKEKKRPVCVSPFSLVWHLFSDVPAQGRRLPLWEQPDPPSSFQALTDWLICPAKSPSSFSFFPRPGSYCPVIYFKTRF